MFYLPIQYSVFLNLPVSEQLFRDLPNCTKQRQTVCSCMLVLLCLLHPRGAQTNPILRLSTLWLGLIRFEKIAWQGQDPFTHVYHKLLVRLFMFSMLECFCPLSALRYLIN